MSSRLKIALVNQPWGHIVPPIQTGGSIPILLYELARRMAQNADVLLYTRGSFRKDVKYDQGVEYRYLPIVWDKAIQKVMDRVPNRMPRTARGSHNGTITPVTDCNWRRDVRRRVRRHPCREPVAIRPGPTTLQSERADRPAHALRVAFAARSGPSRTPPGPDRPDPGDQ